MNGKVKYYLKQTKLLWLPFFIWLFLAVGLVFGINYLSSMPDGAFQKAEADYAETLKLRRLDDLIITSTGMDVELGMSDSRRDIKLELIGEDINPKSLYYQVDGSKLLVRADKFMKRGKLRVILPQGDLKRSAVKVDGANLDIRDFRTDSLELYTTGYDLRLEDIKADKLQVEGQRTNLRLKNNLLGIVELVSPYGNLDLRESQINYLDAKLGGSAFLYGTRWQGQWELRAERGIHAISKIIPFNLLLEAHTLGMGEVAITYEGKWQKARVSDSRTKNYFATLGKGNNSLRLWSEGSIVVEKRARRTTIKPFDEQ